MVDYIEWPRSFVPPQHYNRGYNPFASGRTYLSLSGRFDAGLMASRGDWRPSFVDIPVVQKRSSWLALEGQISGRMKPVAVPYYHMNFYPKSGEIDEETKFSDSSTFSDTATFVTTGTHVTVKDAAAAGATTLTVNKIACGTIQTGHVFSIELHQYQVETVESQTDSEAQITITPELRSAVFSRDEVEFVYPFVKCRLIDPVSMSIEWTHGRWSFPTVKFIEDTTP